MKASQFIAAKGLIHNDENLIKCAEAIEGTEYDIDFLTKEAAPLIDALMAGGKMLMKNPIARNAAIGAGTGALAGAATSESGNKLSGAVRGGLLGAAVGGLGTGANNVYKAMRPAIGPGLGLKQAVTQQANSLKDIGQKSVQAFKGAM